MNQEELKKSLTELIDETISEIEDLKKSDRFSASEIKIEGPGDGIDGKPANGELDAKKADDEKKDEDEDEKKKEKSCDEKDDAEKSDVEKGVNDEAEKSDAEKSEAEKSEAEKSEIEKGVNEQADPNAGNHQPVAKSEEPSEDEELAKTLDAHEELLKSYVDEKIAPIESKLASILNAVQELAETPVERAGVPAGVKPLQKSAEVEPLTKSEVIDKMWDLKKSGTNVPTEDITRVELGGPADLDGMINKYGLTD